MSTTANVYWGTGSNRRKVGVALLRDNGSLTLRIDAGDHADIKSKVRSRRLVAALSIGEPEWEERFDVLDESDEYPDEDEEDGCDCVFCRPQTL